jgi:hypothetical protein
MGMGKNCACLYRLMIVSLRILPTYHAHGDSRLVVLTQMQMVIWKGRGFTRLISPARGVRHVDLGPAMFESAPDWPALEWIRWIGSGKRMLWIKAVFPGQFQNDRFFNGYDQFIFADTPVKFMHIWRVQRRWREIRARRRNLAVCMMTHARLGKACALQAFPELVKMILA